MGLLGTLLLWGVLGSAQASSIFSAAPSGAARPGPVMILNSEITSLVRADACAKATHDRLAQVGRQKKADMIVIESLKPLEAGRSYEVKLEGRSPFVARTKINGSGCRVAQFPTAKLRF